MLLPTKLLPRGVVLLPFLFLFHLPLHLSASACPTTSPSLSTLEQVRISLGTFDTTHQTWSFVISFALYKDDPHALGPTKQTPVACVTDVDIFQGTTTSYTYNVGPHLVTVGYTKNHHYASPWLYHVPITGVQPLSAIQYRVGLVKAGVKSPQELDYLFRDQTFTAYAPPAPGQFNPADGTLRVAIVGDIGQTEHSVKTRDSILYELESTTITSPTIGLIVGDMSYADGGAERWDSWGRMMEPLASRLPIMVLPGNHEIEMDNISHVVFEHYRHRFQMPGLEPEITLPATKRDLYKSYGMVMRYDGGSSYYSMNIGPIHFVCLNSYNTFDSGNGLQQKFLISDLSNVNRKETPFVVVAMHAPFYNSNAGHQGEIATNLMRAWAEPILVQYKVSIVFAGHVHAYERNAGLDVGGVPCRDCPMYVTIGDGGNHELFYDKWIQPTPIYSLYHDSRFYGHGHLIAYNMTHLEWGWDPNPSNVQQGITPSQEDVDAAWVHPYSLRPTVVVPVNSVWGVIDGWAIFFFVCVSVSLFVYGGTRCMQWKNGGGSATSSFMTVPIHQQQLHDPIGLQVVGQEEGGRVPSSTFSAGKHTESNTCTTGTVEFSTIEMPVPWEEQGGGVDKKEE